jgi:outer membrane protein, heavy metal efflux system
MIRHPSIRGISAGQICWLMILLALKVTGCANPPSRKLADLRIRPTSNSFPQHKTRVAPKIISSEIETVSANKERSVANGSVVLAAASLVSKSDHRELGKPIALPEGDEETATAEEMDKLKTADKDETPDDELSEQKPTLGVDELVQMAIAVHPKIQAARSRIAAAQFRIPQASALPDPLAETLFWPIANNAQQLAGGRMANQLSLAQTVPWPEKLRAQAEVAAREVGMAQAEMREIEREIVESVRLAYYEVWYSGHAYGIVHENRKLAEQIVEIAQNRLRAGGSQQDVIRAVLEVEKRDQQLLELNRQFEVAQADLATLIQQPLDLSIETTQDLPASDVTTQLDTLLATAEQCNPALQSLAWQIQRDLQKQRLATLQNYPDLTYGVQYGMMSSSQATSPVADGIDNISFSVGTTLPIWKKKIQAGICQAAWERSSSSQLRQSEWNSIAGRLRRLVQQAHSLDRQRALYVEKMIPRAEQAFEISRSEYTVGKISFVQLIDNFSEVLMFRVEAARIEATLAGVLAQIERTVGC